MSRVVSEVHSCSRQVVVFAAELFLVQTLKGLVIDATDGVAIRKHRVAVGVGVGAEHSSLANPTCALEQSAPCNFRIFFWLTKTREKRHDANACRSVRFCSLETLEGSC